MSSYSKIEDIKPLAPEEFRRTFSFVTGRNFVQTGENRCEVLFVSCHLKDLRFFVTVQKNPTLRSTVRKIAIDLGTYNPKLAMVSSFQKLAQRHGPDCFFANYDQNPPSLEKDHRRMEQWHNEHSHNETVEKANEMFEWYEEHQFRPHFDILDSGLDIVILLQALYERSFPSLDAFELTQLPSEEYPDRKDEPYVPTYRSPNMQELQEAFPGPVPIPPTAIYPRASSTLLPDGYYTQRRLECWRAALPISASCFHPPPMNVPIRGFNLLLNALDAFGNRPIKELTMVPGQQLVDWFHPKELNRASGLSLKMFLPDQKDTIMRLKRVFAGLTVLRLSIDCMDYDLLPDETRLGPARFDGLRELLSSAEKLEILYLDFQRNDGQTGVDILDSIQSRSIREVHLDGAIITAPGLYRLLIRSLALERLILVGGSLVCQYDLDMPASWFATLDEARLKRLFHRRELDIYIDRVCTSRLWANTLDLPGRRPSLEEGFRMWRTWTDNGSEFPFPSEEWSPEGERIRGALRSDLTRALRQKW